MQLDSRLVVLMLCVVLLELMIMVMYTPGHNVVEKVVSPVCHCDWCGQCLSFHNVPRVTLWQLLGRETM